MDYLDKNGFDELVNQIKNYFLTKNIKLTASSVSAGTAASAAYDSSTQTISLKIPNGYNGTTPRIHYGTEVTQSNLISHETPAGSYDVYLNTSTGDVFSYNFYNGSTNNWVYKGNIKGVGISSVTQTTTASTSGGANIITVTKTNGEKSTFQVLNGKDGSSVNFGNISSALGLAYSLNTSEPTTPTASSTAQNNMYFIMQVGTNWKVKICCGFCGGKASNNVTFPGTEYYSNPIVVTSIQNGSDVAVHRGSVTDLTTTGFTLGNRSGQNVSWISMGGI